MVQVSMNLTDFEQTPIHVVFEHVQRLAVLHGTEIAESELIGLMPRKALEMAFSHWLKLPLFEAGSVIETRLQQAVRESRKAKPVS
jgi:glutamate formiminotransferase